MLTVSEQISHLKDKGITFNLYSEEDAAEYLTYNNNYFKLAAYRYNYDRYTTGERAGKYVNLDFAYLRDLAIIDMSLRYVCVQLSLDIEHYAKMEILRLCEAHGEDGCQIVKDFMDSLDDTQHTILKAELNRSKRSIYCRGLYDKYGVGCPPVWVFLELIPFGRMVSLYGFCADRYRDNSIKDNHFLLKSCKEIRNASAHSSCALNDLHPNTAIREPRQSVRYRLANTKGISRQTCTRKMSNARLQQIVILLYVHTLIVTSKGVNNKAAQLLNTLDTRMRKNIEYYENNTMILSSFDFLDSIIRDWFPV